MSDILSKKMLEELQNRTAYMEIRKKIQGSLLTDEETEKLLGVDFVTAYTGHILEYRAIAKAQLGKVLRVLYER